MEVMSLSRQVWRDSQHSSNNLFRKLSESLPAETSLQQRIAFVSVLDTLYTTRALIDGLIGDQGVSQVFVPICAVIIAIRAMTIPSQLIILV